MVGNLEKHFPKNSKKAEHTLNFTLPRNLIIIPLHESRIKTDANLQLI